MDIHSKIEELEKKANSLEAYGYDNAGEVFKILADAEIMHVQGNDSKAYHLINIAEEKLNEIERMHKEYSQASR